MQFYSSQWVTDPVTGDMSLEVPKTATGEEMPMLRVHGKMHYVEHVLPHWEKRSDYYADTGVTLVYYVDPAEESTPGSWLFPQPSVPVSLPVAVPPLSMAPVVAQPVPKRRAARPVVVVAQPMAIPRRAKIIHYHHVLSPQKQRAHKARFAKERQEYIDNIDTYPEGTRRAARMIECKKNLQNEVDDHFGPNARIATFEEHDGKRMRKYVVVRTADDSPQMLHQHSGTGAWYVLLCATAKQIHAGAKRLSSASPRSAEDEAHEVDSEIAAQYSHESWLFR